LAPFPAELANADLTTVIFALSPPMGTTSLRWRFLTAAFCTTAGFIPFGDGILFWNSESLEKCHGDRFVRDGYERCDPFSKMERF
jgi:hypothetical protein